MTITEIGAQHLRVSAATGWPAPVYNCSGGATYGQL